MRAFRYGFKPIGVLAGAIMDADPASLELSREEMYAHGKNVLERVIEHVVGLPDAPPRGDMDVVTVQGWA